MSSSNNSCVTKKNNQPNNNNNKLDDNNNNNNTSNNNLIIKLKLPKVDLPSSSHDNSNTNIIFNPTQNKQEEEGYEEGEEIIKDEDALPPPTTPHGATKKEEEEEKVKVEVDGDGDGVGEVKLHVCPLCNKGFTSGKALGGHKSSHKVNVSAKNKENANEGDDDDDDGDLEVFKCTYCPKEFPSKKSLFGHMRSHPNRPHRGMNPPKEQVELYKGNADVAESLLTVEDRLSKLRTWGATGKRGRSNNGWLSNSSSSSSDASLDSELFEAAETLMLMARGGHYRVRDVFEGSDDVDFEGKRAKKGKGLMTSSSYDNNDMFDDDEAYYLKNLGCLPSNYVADDDANNNMMIDDDDDDDEEPSKATPIRKLSPSPIKIKEIDKIGKVNQKMKRTNLESSSENNHNSDGLNKWVCTICGKSFPTHQALGGHRSSHNKDKQNNSTVVVAQTRALDESRLATTEGSDRGSGSGGGQDELGTNDASHDNNVAVSSTIVAAEHKCKICDKTFSSGQALGGHQRCHYVVPSSSGNSSSPEQSSGQADRVRSSNVNLFDLNVVPEDDDTDDIIVDDSVSNNIVHNLF